MQIVTLIQACHSTVQWIWIWFLLFVFSRHMQTRDKSRWLSLFHYLQQHFSQKRNLHSFLCLIPNIGDQPRHVCSLKFASLDLPWSYKFNGAKQWEASRLASWKLHAWTTHASKNIWLSKTVCIQYKQFHKPVLILNKLCLLNKLKAIVTKQKGDKMMKNPW